MAPGCLAVDQLLIALEHRPLRCYQFRPSPQTGVPLGTPHSPFQYFAWRPCFSVAGVPASLISFFFLSFKIVMCEMKILDEPSSVPTLVTDSQIQMS